MTSSNAVKLNINTLETIENEFNIDFINEINTNRTVFEQETFKINETDIGFDENFESDSEFDSFESEDEEIPDNNDESDIIIEQKKSNNLTSCVLIDKIDGRIQRCKNKESFRTLWQLVGVWQIDNEGVSEVNGSLEKLGVCRNGCSKHSWKLLGKSIQIACNGQHTCPALGECNLICKTALKDIKYSRYICSECYELEGGHFHVKPGKGKLLETYIDQKYHDEDPKKNLEIIARWLFYVKNNKNKEYQEKVLGIFLPTYLQFLNANYLYEINTEIVSNQSQSITTSSNTSHNFFTPTLLKLPTFFMVRVLTRLNQIPIYPDEKELEDDDFEKLGKLAGDKLWQSYKRLKTNKIYLQSPTNITEYIDAFPKFLKIFFEKMFLQLELKKIIRSNQYKILHNKPLKKSDPQKINKTISFLLSVTVGYAFPYFDLWLPTILSSLMKDINPTKRLIRGNNVFNLAIIDNINFKEVSFRFGNIYDVIRGTSHATLRMVFQSILPILTNETPEPVRELNVDTQLFGMTSGMHTMQAKIDQTFEKLLNFQMDINGNISYNKNLDVEIIEKEILSKCEFGCLIPPPNIVILTPTGSPNDDNEIFHATQMYKEEFLLNDDEYLDICADEAIFRRLIKSRTQWEKIRPILGAIGVRFLDKLQAVVDYRSIKRDITAGPINENICIRVWYFYYEYFAMWKSHLIGIRIGNYKLQQDSLTAFALLFPAAGKNNYITSVAHFLSILKKFPKLEEKLQYCTSINLARKGHYPAFDEALEMRGVGYIKQNIIGKVVDQENLTLQIQATQEERKRIDTLLNEFLDPYNYDRNDRKVNNRIDPLWKLIENLVEIFQMDNYTDHELFKKNPPSQLTPEGLKKLSSAYNEGLKRIKDVYCQEVIKTERINTKGRHHLEIVKTDIRSILSSLLLKDTMPTETEINNVLINLPAEWDSQRVKHYYNNNKMSKKKK
ncbi:hypothetical protein GLOIN_2v1777165 [Rhizophagus irregularis DAOM 181602=DAOM 197198]|uniref:Uncharacterized protein n=2 Tax=Rhizophagus irregularis (strain DAOM 181602 / DAOM 197198 / MUCL 43194) TaxID=747089 RepID=A0A2P4PVB3_RHIID|nr:hypothetical protein GLOIN_2v1777165 [Rhizophagus irregularis DAOM 181602=DAOM 197198]POG69339.1 hypothetical protein GLOIN_2v1777165 [Rhizophagus irregularis DAOM 181602=DAOM 197198]|eukprot:XP_025176205.1 hypothetical protein GLOIN_2v1777165 [Rhizophagus irregularis DAOM 181602=DAOM 197198]